MKKLILLTCFCLASTTVWAQQRPLDSFFNKYGSDSSFTVVNISPKMFTLFAQMGADSMDQQTKQVMDIAEELTGLRIISSDNTTNGLKLFRQANSLLSGKNYENLMTVRDDGDHVKFMIKQGSDGTIHSLIMLVGGEDEFTVISISGDINLKDISKIASHMDIQGFDKLGDLDKMDKDK